MNNKISEKIFSNINNVIMIVLILVCAYPLYYVLISSLSVTDPSANGKFFLPDGVTLTTYKAILRMKPIYIGFFVSISRTIIGTVITLVCCSLFAFIMTKKFYLKTVIYRMVIITMYFNAGLIPYFITIKNYRLTDSFLVYVLPSAISAFFIILIKTFMEQIPISLEESAMLDGATFIKVFWYIIIPVSKPILATIAVFSAVGQWNTWMDNFFFVHSENLQTLQIIMYGFLTETESIARKAQSGNYSQMNDKITSTSIRMTITMITTLPIILAYPFLQKYFVKGIMLGAVKG